MCLTGCVALRWGRPTVGNAQDRGRPRTPWRIPRTEPGSCCIGSITDRGSAPCGGRGRRPGGGLSRTARGRSRIGAPDRPGAIRTFPGRSCSWSRAAFGGRHPHRRYRSIVRPEPRHHTHCTYPPGAEPADGVRVCRRTAGRPKSRRSQDRRSRCTTRPSAAPPAVQPAVPPRNSCTTTSGPWGCACARRRPPPASRGSTWDSASTARTQAFRPNGIRPRAWSRTRDGAGWAHPSWNG
jgi:hypothetical protein